MNKKKRYRGSVLISVCVLWMMYFSVFLLLQQAYCHQQLVTSEMKKHYHFLVLENFFWLNQPQLPTKGSLSYSLGDIHYETTANTYTLELVLTSGEQKKIKKAAE